MYEKKKLILHDYNTIIKELAFNNLQNIHLSES